MNKYCLSFLADSNPASGSIDLRNSGSTFDVYLDRPLIIPAEAEECYLTVKNATVWWTVPNISVARGNNKFRFQLEAAQGFTTFTIPDGLYSFATLIATIEVLVQEVNENIMFLWQEIFQSNKVSFQFNNMNNVFTNDSTFSFITEDSVAPILGWTDEDEFVFDTSDPDKIFISPNPASFNTINYFLINIPTLLSRGLNFNSVYRGTVARIPIDVDPGSQIQYDPRQTYSIPADELPGTDFTKITFQLTDDSNNTVDTQGEYWSVLFEISYVIPEGLD